MHIRDELELVGRLVRLCPWHAGPSCSSESWPRLQEVISRRAAAAVIHHQYQWLTAAYLSGIDWRTMHGGTKAVRPINGGISLSLNVCFLILNTDWSGSLQYCGDFYFFIFFCSVLWEGVGGEWWTLWCWQPAELLADVHGICARILLCSPFTAKNPQISLRGLIQIYTLISEHIIPSQRYGDQ